MSGICIDGIRAALARKADCARCSNAWKCNELTGCYGFCEESEESEEEERAAEEEAEEEIEEVMETISQPHRGGTQERGNHGGNRPAAWSRAQGVSRSGECQS